MQYNTGSRKWLVVCLYAAGFGVGGALLLQHWVHIPAVLPYLLFLACPLMHLFMHRSHNRHKHANHHDPREDAAA